MVFAIPKRAEFFHHRVGGLDWMGWDGGSRKVVSRMVSLRWLSSVHLSLRG